MAELFPVFKLPSGVIRRTLARPKPAYLGAPLFDFEKGDFVVDGAGNIVIGDGYQAAYQWGVKASLTDRQAHMIYPPSFGTRLRWALDRPDRGSREAALKVVLTESWLANPQFVEVRDFSFEWGPGSALEVQFVPVPAVCPPDPLQRERIKLHGF